MKRLLVIGVGAGDPEHITVQAIGAMNRVDVFFVLDKGQETEDLVLLRKQLLDQHMQREYRTVQVPDPQRDLRHGRYEGAVQAWHQQRIELYRRLLDEELPDGACGAFLVWGDPALYDSTLRLLDEVLAGSDTDIRLEVVPGISSVAALAAAHRIPLNRVGEPIHITSGRRLAAGDTDPIDNVVVMLDGRCAFAEIDDADLDIYWGAYLGTPDEILIAGPLQQRKEEILRVRAAARERKGWMFDTYLLRRREAQGAVARRDA